ncbi:Hypothetical predicted protein [Mytilus galloprovincialis]|uniref:Reverse transcriptase domain-containing protein n=1 Tax=Mytilus galloprovincialis TaxID=29158 RepID=A0A8B6CL08_MYTGA|nr:Hypothetical predicted protein [Mytilus galloprovincialis]
MSSAVRWEGKLSTSFAELQGVRQGSVWSPSVYKLFVNPLIKKLESESLGFKIGNVFVGTPMCADDLLLISSKPDELQTMISYTSHFAETEEYNIKTLETVENYKHIGIDRDSREVEATRTIIGNRLKTARQTSYALMGSGLHGLNGLNPEVSCKLWSTYVVPRLLFGLEIVNLSAKDISRLDIFCNNFLKQIQNLPARASNAGAYLLLGQLPIIALLHKKILITFGTIARSDSVENDLAKRQLSTKGKNSKSWFIRADKILKQYNLPCASEVLLKPETKYKWKMKVKKCIDNFWSEKLFTEAKSKPSLRYLNIKNCKIGVVNSIWKSAGSEQMCIRKACYKIKMLLDTYILQYHRSKFSNGQKTSICPLCEEGTEHLEHFLVVCSALTSIRDIFISKLYTVVVPKIGTVAWTDICVSNSKMIQLILDCSRFEWYHVLEKNDINLVESITRSLCYSLHEKRSVLLETTLQWEVNKTSEIIFGETDIELICSGTPCCTGTTRQWTGGPTSIILMTNGVPSDLAKYEETRETNSFSLILKPLEITDVNAKYQCALDFDSSPLTLLLPSADVFRYVPDSNSEIEITKNFTGSTIYLTANLTRVFPTPECAATYEVY